MHGSIILKHEEDEEEEENVVLSRNTRVGIGVGRHLVPTPSDRCVLTRIVE